MKVKSLRPAIIGAAIFSVWFALGILTYQEGPNDESMIRPAGRTDGSDYG
jgi:hypothetical protein